MSYNSTMKAVTIREAKARLNALVKAAERGEQVVLMRGSKHVAVILPVSAEDLELAPGLTDTQAERLWRRLEEERREGTSVLFDSARQAVTHLDTGSSPQTRRGRRASKKPSASTRSR
ncbi:MAG TPA: type II toxin-antitoxin system prevent-host-death family antitoxin [Methylomirabilota bacterium]|nr:type II toxin-antitoxin system prevent-host-death family antitoxin [Methylomirabilota bacterium]